MKLSSWLVILCVIVGENCFGQFSVQWQYDRFYYYGNVQEARVDQTGGFFLGSRTVDTACGYDLGDLIHVNSVGSTSWSRSLHYEAPCIQQLLQEVEYNNTNLWCSIQDTSGWVILYDTSGGEIWRVDTGQILRAAVVLVQNKLVAYEPQWSEIYQFNANGGLEWAFQMSYSYVTQIRNILRDGNGNLNVIYEFNDVTQSDPTGVGIVQLDSNGVFMWDTIFNTQTPVDIDYYVDSKLDEQGNIFIAGKDVVANGCFLYKISSDGSNVINLDYTPNPIFRPTQVEIDNVHNLVYVTGRTSGAFEIIKLNNGLSPLDTMFFYRQFPDVNVIAINEYGYLLNLWVSDSNGFELRLTLTNHLGQQVDQFVYWNSVQYQMLFPHSILQDSLGGIFIICNGLDNSSYNWGAVWKLQNPSNVQETVTKDYSNYFLFPNPAQDKLHVNSNTNCNVQLTIVDCIGNAVYSQSQFGGSFEIDISGFANGLYNAIFTYDNLEIEYHKLTIAR